MTDILKELPFWSALTDGEKSICERNSVISRYDAGTFLLGDCTADRCLGMIHIISGEIRAYTVSDEGREITLFRLSPGEDCVLSASCVLSQISFDTQLFVTADSEVLIIPSAVYHKLMDTNIHVRCFSFELITKRFSEVMQVMQQLLFYSFDKRLAGFLLSEYDRTDEKEIRMTQAEIAVATNSAREVVARMLKRFVSDGFIESRRGIILLKNIEALRNISE